MYNDKLYNDKTSKGQNGLRQRYNDKTSKETKPIRTKRQKLYKV
jgi:hypothetical protein